jgi:hypothetical protein
MEKDISILVVQRFASKLIRLYEVFHDFHTILPKSKNEEQSLRQGCACVETNRNAVKIRVFNCSSGLLNVIGVSAEEE